MAIETYGVTAEEVFETIGFADAEMQRAGPKSATVDKWVLRFSAELEQALRGAGTLVTVDADSAAYEHRRQQSIARTAGEWHIAKERGNTEYGRYLVGRWDIFIEDLRSDTGHVTGTAGQARSAAYTSDAGLPEPHGSQRGQFD